jgi:hypothetical protein
MAKDRISQYSGTRDDNTDVGGIGILGTNKIGNVDDALRTIMKHLAELNSGVSPLYDTASICDPTDNTKMARFDTGSITTGNLRVITVGDANIHLSEKQGAPLVTEYTSSGTHTLAATTRYFKIIATGGGAGGESVQGSPDYGYGAGGASGHHGESAITARGSIATGTVTIGVKGISWDGATRTNGGATIWSDGTNTYTFAGGVTDGSVLATSATVSMSPGANGSQTALDTTLRTTQNLGFHGNTGIAKSVSGHGGSTFWGRGGVGIQLTATDVQVGADATGYGSGGGGAAIRGANGGSIRHGGDGAPGKLIVLEW